MGKHTKGDRVGREPKVKSHKAPKGDGCLGMAVVVIASAATATYAAVEAVRSVL